MKLYIFAYFAFYLFQQCILIKIPAPYIPSDRQIRVVRVFDAKRVSQIIFRNIEHEIDVLEGHPDIDIIHVRDGSPVRFLVLEQELGDGSMFLEYPGLMGQLYIAYEERGKHHQKSDGRNDEKRLKRGHLLQRILEHIADEVMEIMTRLYGKNRNPQKILWEIFCGCMKGCSWYLFPLFQRFLKINDIFLFQYRIYMLYIRVLFYFLNKENESFRILFTLSIDEIKESVVENDKIYLSIIQMIKNLSECFLCEDIEFRNNSFPGSDGKEKTSGFLIFSR